LAELVLDGLLLVDELLLVQLLLHRHLLLGLLKQYRQFHKHHAQPLSQGCEVSSGMYNKNNNNKKRVYAGQLKRITNLRALLVLHDRGS
jgi:hypothetical protein